MKFWALSILIFFGKVQADPRCNMKFVEELSAKQECIKDGNVAACAYLGMGGVALGASAQAFTGLINKHFPDKTYPGKLRQIYRMQYESGDLERKFVDIMVDKVKSNRLTADEYLKRVEKEVNKTGNERLIKAFTIAKPDLEKNPYSAEPVDKELYRQVNEEVKKILPEESALYEKLKTEHDEKVRAYVKKADPTYEEDMKKLWAERDLLEQEIRKSSEPQTDELLNKKGVNNNEIFKRNELFSLRTSKRVNHLNSEFDNKLVEKHPKAYLVKDLTLPSEVHRHQAYKNIGGEKIHRVFRNPAIGIAAGSGAALLGNAALGIALEKKVAMCAKSANLTPGEVEFLKGRIANIHLASECKKMRLLDPKEDLKDAFVEFGHVPTGICEMALRENERLDLLAQPYKVTSVSCQFVETDHFKIEKQSDGENIFSCTGPSKVTYKMPLRPNFYPDFERVRAYYNDRETPNYSSKMRQSYRTPAAFTAPSGQKAPDPQEQHYRSCTETSRNDDICSCVLSAHMAKAYYGTVDLKCRSSASSPKSDLGNK